MKSLDKMAELAGLFEAKLRRRAQVSASAQAGDFQHALEGANLWSYNSIASVINPFLDKIGFQSKFDTEIVVDKTGTVKIVAKGVDPKIAQVQAFLQKAIAPKMSSIFKNNKLAAADTVVVPWLSQAG
jgi:hypothetical protein